MTRRRKLLAYLATTLVAPRGLAMQTDKPVTGPEVTPRSSPVPSYAAVVPGYVLRFPQDEGSHPAFRTEWWYITGWLQSPGRAPAGFQVTFFRTRPDIDEANPSAFTPHQIMIAHAALSDANRGRLSHDQRAARAVFGLAGAGGDRTQAWIDDWSLKQDGKVYRARIPARDFAFDFTLTPTQAPLVQGDGGVSRKGPAPESASYYYSIPQLEVSGALAESGKRFGVTGTAWFDHEWSSSYMDARAAGWDWIGINFDDGSALMAFRMRERSGGKLWAGGAFRSADGLRRVFAPGEVEFAPLREWRSPRSGASYPVVWRIRAGELEITVEPLMDDQENDTRASVGTIYWEGAVRALRDKKPVGRGYLELTGYWKPMRL